MKSIKTLLREKGIRPSKRLGQNFLVSLSALNKIIRAVDLKPEDIVLEPGPGLGALTIALAQRVKKVIAVEKDKRLAQSLREILEDRGIKNVKVFEGDILNFHFSIKDYKVVANLPYNIAAAVVMKFLEAEKPPQLMVVMLQKEVGQRMYALPPKMSKLAVFCQFYSQPKIIATVSKKAFFPQPKVDSVILKITPRPPSQILLRKTWEGKFARIVKAGFSHPRKQLVNNLSKELGIPRPQTTKWLLKNNINPTHRAQTLTVDDWLNLTETFKNNRKYL